MIKLHGFGPNFGLPDPSPFVMKVDAYMRMAGIEFETESGLANMKKAPKGKLPFITDGNETIGDSTFIFSHLEDKHGATLDAWLSDEQRGLVHLLMKSLDENLYWCLVHSRWIRDDTWPLLKETFFGKMPFPVRMVLPGILRRGVQRDIVKHGMGKHSDAEIQEIARRSLQSLSGILGDKPYFFGDQPCSFDATAYGILSELILSSIHNPLNQLARSFKNLVGFCEQVQSRYYAAQ